MINKKVEDAMNKQIGYEVFSANLYWAMAAYFESINLRGFAHWLICQYNEEITHAMKFYKHIIDRNGRAVIPAIEKPQFEWKSPLEAFEAAYKHEVKVTGLINEIVKISDVENDYASRSTLQWFVDEQIEEEAQTDAIVQQLKAIGEKSSALFMIDHHLSKRGEK